ncbi:hypothetical protein COT51_03265 [candidate division WWE3 bacterium CG08_land_8_20_14_0_20_41_15]|uniref:DUF458 domain-containing protein n=1 Tax=candidate division WWE3 bacterium CG08_land_8_20_14_0_20_41_15 TaxID=1975086 RepID=A0A2H0X8S7_UNCKA|nr:MAG: hypothetical protein COT51_03265 [candidate division WWE3 bacterium CG08_land_8_20_14_0_20_41_15]
MTDSFLELFNSPTYGTLTLSEVREKVASFMAENKDANYRVIIGVDSQMKNHGEEADFVGAIIVHRLGGGGVYFWSREKRIKKYVLRTRIYEEATCALELAHKFLDESHRNGLWGYDFEVHVDIGNVGETRVLISEVVGMVRASGFKVKTKPDSFAASKVADRYT